MAVRNNAHAPRNASVSRHADAQPPTTAPRYGSISVEVSVIIAARHTAGNRPSEEPRAT